jgi:hypothetical protein
MNLVQAIDGITDVRFKRYLTPYIIRVLWALALIVAFGGLLFNRFALPVLYEAAKHAPGQSVGPDWNAGKAAQNPAPVWNRDRAVFAPAAPQPSQPNPAGVWLAYTALYILVTVFCLLILRVTAEFIIVVFNISNDLKEAKLRLAQRG